jgi:hypothetical protein
VSAGSLLETMTAVALQAVAFAGLGGLCASAAGMAGTAADVADTVQAFIHVEHLIDAAAARAGTGPGAAETGHSIDDRRLVELPADLDYDGRVDATSKERTAVTISPRPDGEAGLVLRLGRQSVAIGPAIADSDEISQGVIVYGESASTLTHWFSLPTDGTGLIAIARRQSGR